jgi:2-dehydropantoate 2-reductase
MKICVVGAGAIGGVLAWRLAASGHHVSVIARGAHLDAIHAHGLTLVDHLDGGATRARPMAADWDAARLAAAVGIQDAVLIALKAHAIPAMLASLAPLIGDHTMVVPAINGVPWWYFHREGGRHDGAHLKSLDPEGQAFGALDCAHVLGCVVHVAAEVRAPGVVHHTGGRRLITGEIDRSLAGAHSGRIATLAGALVGAGFETVVSQDIRTDVWTKLIGNLSFNPVAALTSSLMNQICADEGLLVMIRSMMTEGMEVGRRYGIHIAMTPDQRIDLARQLGSARISMLQDFEARRTPEIDAIVGAVIELAEWESVDVPTVRMIDALARARARNLGLLAS